MQKLYLLDASGYIYRSYFAIRNMTNAKGESTNALFGFIRSVLKFFKDFSPEYVVAVFDGPNNSKAREEIYAEYKSHRAAAPLDLFYQIDWARQFCEVMGIPMLNLPDVEADDTMGSVAVWAAKEGMSVFLCTSDKDMCQLVNDQIFILNTFKDNLILGSAEVEENYGVTPSQIIDYLAIIGDASDNIPGLPGFGPKTAASLLKQFGTLDHILANPQEVPGVKKQEVLIHEADKARLSRQLVQLNLNVDFPKDLDFFKLKSPAIPLVKEFYTQMNFNSLMREFEESLHQTCEKPVNEAEIQMPSDYRLVETEKDLQELLLFLQKQKEICFDTETTNIHPIKADLVGIGFGIEPEKAWYVPLNGSIEEKKVLEAIKPLFENAQIGFYGHNVKYDCEVLANYGIKVKNICFDTILASYILNTESRAHSLDFLSLQYFKKVKIPTSSLIGKGKNQITMREVPIQDVSLYCCEDVDYTCRLKLELEKELHQRKLTHLLKDVEIPLLSVLMGMERRGIYLDTEILSNISHDVVHQIELSKKEIYELVGHDFNLNSPKQISQILFVDMGIKPPRKTATGHSTDADVLEKLQFQYPIAGKILEYRILEKLRSTYIDSLPLEINQKTHRIHCQFNQSGTATGRLACQDPNLQNIPVRGVGQKIREAFRPERKGWSYLSADYSQIELRLLAHFSEDPMLIKAFNDHEDIHSYTASLIFHTPLAEVTKEMRYHAKAVNFGVIYGQQAFGLAQTLGIDVKDAASFIEAYFGRYKCVKDYVEYCKEQVLKTGKAVTMMGRERAIPEIHSKNAQIRAAAQRLAVNTPLQGTAAELIKLAMLKIDRAFSKENKLGFMILQIHDELIFELPDFEIFAVEPEVREIMQGVLKLKVPLIVDISVGKNWKEC